MLVFLKRADDLLASALDWVCTALLIGIVVVVLYTVVMRYGFKAPPFWGDTVSMLFNVSMVLLGVGLAVRRRDLIAMQALYERISPLFAMFLEVIWMTVIVIFAVVFTYYGYQVADKIPGFYWELARMPKKYTMMIMPVSGVLLFLAAVRIWIVDISRLVRLIKGE